jgi:hypothetical protein
MMLPDGDKFSKMLNKNTKIKTMTLSLLAVTGMAILATSGARAGDQDFTLVNKTGVEIHALHVAPHSSDEWGEDILGKDTLANGESLEITFGKHDRAHHWDLRIEDEKGNALTWENLDLMSIEQVTLHYKDGKAWADLK